MKINLGSKTEKKINVFLILCLKPLQVQKAISYHLLNLANGKINFKIYMKKVIIFGLSAVVLVPLLFGFYAVWWSEHTYKLEEAVDYCEYTTKLLEG